jgi:hypothetical protein
MKRYLVPVLIATLVAVILPFALAEESGPKVTGRFYETEGVRVLELWGTPRERGFAHGYLLAEDIVKGGNSGFAFVEQRQPGKYQTRVLPLAGMGFKFSKSEEEELAGILAGIKARLEPEERKMEALGRELSIADLKALNTFGDWYALGCSSAAVWGGLTEDGTPAVARNFDFMGLPIIQQGQFLVVVAPGPGEKDAHGFVGMTHPGSIGAVTALSAEGVFASIHDVPVKATPKDFMQGNVPRLVAIRRIVAALPAKGAVEAAAASCKSWNTLFGNNFLVATPEPGDGLPAGVIEYDTREELDGGAVLRAPETGPEGERLPFVVCSNHHRLRDTGRCGRYRTLTEACAGSTEALDVEALFDLAEKTAFPRNGAPLRKGGFGTQHQTVALTGQKILLVRVGTPGKAIRDVTPVAFDVPKLLAGIAERAE